MSDRLAVISALLLIITAAAHSMIGEQRLIRPLLERHDGILAVPLARFILRAAWHLTSVSWLVLATALLAMALRPDSAFRITLAAVGIAFAAAGIYDAFGSRGRHVGWPMLTAIGLVSLAALAAG